VLQEPTTFTSDRMRRDNKAAAAMPNDGGTYLTYRPLSNLPTPPPTYKDVRSPPASASSSLDSGEPLKAKYRGTF
jgi:hypothetical protein